MYSFGGGSDRAAPGTGLIDAADGTLYGLTAVGGRSSGGTVFAIN